MSPQPSPPAVYANSQTWVGCAIETVRGVPAAAPDFWIPIIDPQVKPAITELEDHGYRGQMNTAWHQKQGPTYTNYQFRALAHIDVLPNLLRSALGSPDMVTPSGDLFDHTLSLLNNAAPDQPPSYTWFDYDGYRVRRMAGGQTDTLILEWKRDGLVQVTVKLLAYPYEVLSDTAEAFISTIPPSTGWDVTASLAGAPVTTLVEGSFTLKRGVVAIPTLAAQTPYSLFADRLDVRGLLTFLNTDDAQMDAYIGDDLFALNLAFDNVAIAPYRFLLDFGACKFSLGAQQRGTDGLITAMMTVLPLPNVGNATAGGASPMRATLRTPQATAY